MPASRGGQRRPPYRHLLILVKRKAALIFCKVILGHVIASGGAPVPQSGGGKKGSSPIVDNVKPGMVIGGLIGPVHRYSQDLGAEALGPHGLVSLLAAKAGAGQQ